MRDTIPKYLFLTLILFISHSVLAQSDTAAIRKKVETKQYTFVAQSATPQNGRVIQLTSVYDLRIAGDSVISNLPYYGRSYSAPMGNDTGLGFTSSNSDYTSKWKKNRWEITIKPKDHREVNELNLTIFNNGSASLRVSSNNRQPISFSGYISIKKE